MCKCLIYISKISIKSKKSDITIFSNPVISSAYNSSRHAPPPIYDHSKGQSTEYSLSEHCKSVTKYYCSTETNFLGRILFRMKVPMKKVPRSVSSKERIGPGAKRLDVVMPMLSLARHLQFYWQNIWRKPRISSAHH